MFFGGRFRRDFLFFKERVGVSPLSLGRGRRENRLKGLKMMRGTK